MVTHDRYFLDRVAGRILEVDRGKVYSYPGSYHIYVERREERLDMARASEREAEEHSENRAAVAAKRRQSPLNQTEGPYPED